MRCKYDYITNSSSASFILYIESTIKDLEEFKEEFNNYIIYESEEYGAGSKYHVLKNRNIDYDGDFRFPIISRLSSNTFKIEVSTSMFNGFEDLPSYMIDLLIKNSMVEDENGQKHEDIRDLPSFIKSVKFEVGDY